MKILSLIILLMSQTIIAGEKADAELKLSTKGDDIAFNKNMVQLKYRKTIRIKFTNEATKDSEILHDIAILKPGTRKKFMDEYVKTDYDRTKILKHPDILAFSNELKPGDSDIIEFKPKEPGAYPFVCLMAGHADMLGMHGILHIVKKQR